MDELISVYSLVDSLAAEVDRPTKDQWAEILKLDKIKTRSSYAQVSGFMPGVLTEDDLIRAFEDLWLRAVAADKFQALIRNAALRKKLPEWYRTNRHGAPMLVDSDAGPQAALAGLDAIIDDFDALISDHRSGLVVLGKSTIWPRIQKERRALHPVGFRKAEIFELLRQERGDHVPREITRSIEKENSPVDLPTPEKRRHQVDDRQLPYQELRDSVAREVLSSKAEWRAVNDATNAVWAQLRYLASLEDGKRPHCLDRYKGGEVIDYQDLGPETLLKDTLRKRVETLLEELGKRPPKVIRQKRSTSM